MPSQTTNARPFGVADTDTTQREILSNKHELVWKDSTTTIRAELRVSHFGVLSTQDTKGPGFPASWFYLASFQHLRLLLLLPIFAFPNPISPLHFITFLIHNQHSISCLLHLSFTDSQSEACVVSRFPLNFHFWSLISLFSQPMSSTPSPPCQGPRGTGTSLLPDHHGETEQRSSFSPRSRLKDSHQCPPPPPIICPRHQHPLGPTGKSLL